MTYFWGFLDLLFTFAFGLGVLFLIGLVVTLLIPAGRIFLTGFLSTAFGRLIVFGLGIVSFFVVFSYLRHHWPEEGLFSSRPSRAVVSNSTFSQTKRAINQKAKSAKDLAAASTLADREGDIVDAATEAGEHKGGAAAAKAVAHERRKSVEEIRREVVQQQAEMLADKQNEIAENCQVEMDSSKDPINFDFNKCYHDRADKLKPVQQIQSPAPAQPASSPASGQGGGQSVASVTPQVTINNHVGGAGSSSSTVSSVPATTSSPPKVVARAPVQATSVTPSQPAKIQQSAVRTSGSQAKNGSGCIQPPPGWKPMAADECGYGS